VFEVAYGAGTSLANAMLPMAAATAQRLVFIMSTLTFWERDGMFFWMTVGG
jgi:hypothetical protein